MQQYQSIDKSFPDRLLKMAEKEQDSILEFKRKVIEDEASKQKRGQNYAFILAIVCLLLAGLILYWDSTNYIVSAILVSLSVGPSSFVSLYDSKNRKRE